VESRWHPDGSETTLLVARLKRLLLNYERKSQAWDGTCAAFKVLQEEGLDVYILLGREDII
jgi:hypothetical protein